MAEVTVRDSAGLQEACNKAAPGDVIWIAPGIYDSLSLLAGTSGAPGNPVIFRGAGSDWISGGRKPDAMWGAGDRLPSEDGPPKPSTTDFALLVMDTCKHILIDGLNVRDCWPSIFLLKDCEHITIRNCRLSGATFAIFAKGGTSHLLIERNVWQQDDSPGHELWSKISWAEAHGGEGSNGQYRYFNGGFLSGQKILGQVIIRNNWISDAYNGIRLKCDYSEREVKKGAGAPFRNSDVHIYDNDFVRIRDNPVEPEEFAYNWHVRHNRLVDCHAWFSFNGVAGGYWYFYGNTARFETREGLAPDKGGDPHAPNTTGRVMKLSYHAWPLGSEADDSFDVPEHPWYVFNNSWLLRCPLIDGTNPQVGPGREGPDFTARLRFLNNAFERCNPACSDDWTCAPVPPMRNFDFGNSPDITFDYSLFTSWQPFDYRGSFPPGTGHEANGMIVAGPVFEGASMGDFRLVATSTGRDSAQIADAELPGGRPTHARTAQNGKLHRGAVQEYGLIEMPELEDQAKKLLDDMGAPDLPAALVS